MEQSNESLRLIEQAPLIKASGLADDYHALAEFNGIILAGHQTRFGMEFVTWEWVQHHTSLWQGHYFGGDFEAAKQDFVTRSGLLLPQRLFSDRQLAEMYRCIRETLENDCALTPARENLLTEAAEKIEIAVPELENLLQAFSNVQQQDDLQMTQQF